MSRRPLKEADKKVSLSVALTPRLKRAVLATGNASAYISDLIERAIARARGK